MARTSLAVVIVAVALAGVAPATGRDLPLLRSASVDTRHVVLQVAVGDVRPVQLTVADRSDVGANGALLAKNVVRRETIKLAPAATSGVVRWKSRMTLAPGAYFVQVTAVDRSAGLIDCPPKLMRTCLDRWSNVRRIVVPASD
jgi:hypothetical protein